MLKAEAAKNFAGAPATNPHLLLLGFCRFATNVQSGALTCAALDRALSAYAMAVYKRRRCPLWIVSRGITTAIYFKNDDNYSDALLC